MKSYECVACGSTFNSRKGDKNRTPKFCSKECFQKRKLDESTRVKMSSSKVGKTPWNKGVNMWVGKEHPRGMLGKKSGRGGERCHFWRGGICKENERIRKSPEYKSWRDQVFKRDLYTCVLCGSQGYLHADHILPYSTHPQHRFDLSNGRTLCATCHMKTDTYGGKMIKKIAATVMRNDKVFEGFDASS